jgi:hypothetical protein
LVCAKAGDLIVWDSRTIHCNTPAVTASTTSLRDAGKEVGQEVCDCDDDEQRGDDSLGGGGASGGSGATLANTLSDNLAPTTGNPTGYPIAVDSMQALSRLATPAAWSLIRQVAYVCMTPVSVNFHKLRMSA